MKMVQIFTTKTLREARQGSSEWCLWAPGNEALSPLELKRVLERVEQADVLAVSRLEDKSSGLPAWDRRIQVWLYRILLGINLQTVISMVLFKRKILLDQAAWTAILGSAFFKTRLMVQALKRGYRVEEVVLDSRLDPSREPKDQKEHDLIKNKSMFRWLTLVWVLGLLGFGILSTFFAEKIEVGKGFGWDGVRYGWWSQNFYFYVFEKGLDSYYLRRILPSAIIHYSLDLLGIPKTISNVLHAFGLYNTFLFSICAILWHHIAGTLRIGFSGRWIGFLGLFVNYFVLKVSFFYPVRTDVTAFASGLLIFFLYLTKRPVWLFLISIIASFAWPTSFLLGSVLLIFPRADDKDRKQLGFFSMIVALAFTGIILHFIRSVYISGEQIPSTWWYIPLRRPRVSEVNWSLGIMAAYVFLGFWGLLNNRKLYNPPALWAGLNLRGLILAGLGFLGMNYAVQALSTGPSSIVSTEGSIHLIALSSIMRPGIIILSHVVYFGPVLLLVPLFWKNMCDVVHRMGFGITAVFLMGFLLSLDSESRHSLNFYPILVVILAKAADGAGYGKFHLTFLSGMAVLASKVWLEINPDFLRFFLMSMGLNMPEDMYLVQGKILLEIMACLYFAFWLVPNKRPPVLNREP